MDLATLLPRFAIVDTARQHDSIRTKELCAGLAEGEIVIFDKAYVDFAHLWALASRGIFFVTRAKDNLACRVKRRRPNIRDRRILKDELVVLKGHYSRKDYPGLLRRVTALVEVDGQVRVMVFLTNNIAWAASSVGDLYQCRWSIETLFKELKQTMQLVDFLGHSANAVKWQVWTALLVHLLLHFQAWQSHWTHSFTRLTTYIRAALWLERDLYRLLKRCGTADGNFRCLGSPEQAWPPGFARNPVVQPA